MIIEEQTTLFTLDSMSDSVVNAPLEAFWPAFDLIQTAVWNGIHVVEAAGNGGLDLGSFDSDSIFIDPAKYSGAILVGAGSPGPLMGVSGYQARQRIEYSNYGPSPDTSGRQRRVDVQGWGDLVATTGYYEDSSIFDGEGVHAAYQWFWGTSAATPVVAGAVAVLESLYEQCNPGYTMEPEDMRLLLRNTGLPQMGSDSATHPIGPLVNLKNAIDSVLTCAANCCSGKRGNVDQDPNNVVDLSDLPLLVDYLDAPPCWNELPCPSAVDVNGDSYFNSSDLTVLLQYLLFNNDQRASCP